MRRRAEEPPEDRPARDDDQDAGGRGRLAEPPLPARLRAARLRGLLRRDARPHALDADVARGRRQLGARRRVHRGDHAPLRPRRPLGLPGAARRRPLLRHERAAARTPLRRRRAADQPPRRDAAAARSSPRPAGSSTSRPIPVQLQLELQPRAAGDARLPRAALRLLHLRRELGQARLRPAASGALPLRADPPAGRHRPLARPLAAAGRPLHDDRQLAPGLARRDLRGRALHLEQAPRVPQVPRPAASAPARASSWR